MANMKTIEIAPSVHMPIMGIGTWEMRDPDVLHAVLDAGLGAGYRFIDTATSYQNEEFIGRSLQILLPKYGLTRKDIFITSKLSTKDQGADRARAGGLKSVENLGMEYVDLYLIHFPGSAGIKSDDPKNAQLRRESWLELQKLKDEGKFRAIGVSNYMKSHLEELPSYTSATSMPVVNQCEFHPYMIPAEAIQLCKTMGIHFQAYSSIGTAYNKEKLFNDPIIQGLAEKYQCSPVHLLLAWAINQGVSVLPKSTNPEHVKSNLKALEITMSEEDIDKMASIGKKERFCWDPTKIV